MGFGMQRQMLSADLRDDEVCEFFKGTLHLAATNSPLILLPQWGIEGKCHGHNVSHHYYRRDRNRPDRWP